MLLLAPFGRSATITLSIIISCKQYKNNHSVLNNRFPNNTQITTNNISGLLRCNRPLRFIEDQLSLINRTVKNISQNTSRKINGVLDAYLQETLGGQENPLQKTRERREKIYRKGGQEPSPKNSTTFLRSRKNNNNKTKVYTSYIQINSLNGDQTSIELRAIFEINQLN